MTSHQKTRLDQWLVNNSMVSSRSQAESYIKLGDVLVNGVVVRKSGYVVKDTDKISLSTKVMYVSRAGHKLASVASFFNLNFKNKTVLDVGSSTGGFTDFALKNGAKKVIAVEIGKNQLHSTLRVNTKIELHEQTDILSIKKLRSKVDIVVIDVSFISLRDILPHISNLVSKSTEIVAMVKPQFEARQANIKHKGVIKNENIRRKILKDFEAWAMGHFIIRVKKDSEVSGEKGNKERFYLLTKM